jgi:hypothetical protein
MQNLVKLLCGNITEVVKNQMTELLKDDMTKFLEVVKDEMTEFRGKIGERISKVESAFQSLVRPFVSMSPSLLGRAAFDDLKENKLLKSFVASASAPIFSEEEYQKMQDIQSEVALVDVISERIQVLLPTRKVVSSEVFPWLVAYKGASAYNLKLDLCIANPAFFEIRGSRGALPTGIPADPSIYVGVSLIDAKVSTRNKNQALGEATVHSQYLETNYVRHNSTAFVFHHAVAYKEEIFLFKFRGGILEATRVPWSAGGSAALLIDHFRERDPISRVLKLVLDTKKLHLHHDPCVFLGAGATGVVFRVREDESDKEFALKIVVGENCVRRLIREYERNQEISAECVVKGCDFIHLDAIGGAGMLMEEVGTKVVPEKVLDESNKILAAMVRLHSKGYVHGDARVAKLLNCHGIYKWCDVERSSQTSDATRLMCFRDDIRTLRKSLNRRTARTNIDMNSLKNYASRPSSIGLLELLS